MVQSAYCSWHDSRLELDLWLVMGEFIHLEDSLRDNNNNFLILAHKGLLIELGVESPKRKGKNCTVSS